MIRYDRFALKAKKTDEGFIRDTPTIGRTGLLTYYNHDGTKRIEYRPPDEAFNADSLSSLQGKPITVGHKAMVTSGNAAAVQPVGTVLSAGRQDGDAIVADVVIYDLPTDARELSCGYKLNLDESPGTTPEGKHYDAIQRNIRYNHVAVVPRGRAGIARLNMDGDQEFTDTDKDKGESKKMTKLRLDTGLEYDTAPEVQVAYNAIQTQNTDLKAKIDALQATYDALQANYDTVKAAKEDLEKTGGAKFDAAVQARVGMLQVAQSQGIDHADGMTDKEIKMAVVKKVRGDTFNLDGKSDEYINAAFDIAKDEQVQHADGMAKQRQQVHGKPSGDTPRNDQQDENAYDLKALMAKIRKDEAEAYLKGE